MAKTCAFCDKTDGLCYTSNPPVRKCTITGKFHNYNHICDVPKTNADRIRAMSDEELLNLLSAPRPLFRRADDKGCPNPKPCRECIAERLKQPAEEET